MSRPPDPDDTVFRSLAAPGLEEDDLFAALSGLSTPGAIWGDGWGRSADPACRWDEELERRGRHEQLLRKWAGEGGPRP